MEEEEEEKVLTRGSSPLGWNSFAPCSGCPIIGTCRVARVLTVGAPGTFGVHETRKVREMEMEEEKDCHTHGMHTHTLYQSIR